ncbi:hypothetical protein C8D88_11034 [Lentzea atacamensis]|uniref:Uncharacterized protein n=2 Tax=Lentzea atacamensis TaxID=531938 RepID=A0A316HU49_9PSEU|nr:hypothetical protein C8D88_11034 [Lentzea atacamensis]
MREIIEVILSTSTNHAMRLMFLANATPLMADLPDRPDNPFTALVAEAENVVRDGFTNGEFCGLDDVQLTVELLSGAMRAGVERISRDPDALSQLSEAQEIVLAAITRDKG